jgi:rare lipoprotein A (peptidoglycan hydrolase)
MRRILAILILCFIGALFASNISMLFSKDQPNTEIKAARAICKAEKKEPAKNPKQKEKESDKAPEKSLLATAELPEKEEIRDGLHRATWYRTEGTRVHREHPTAAYNFAEKGTFLLVTNTQNGKSCIVEVTDRMGDKKKNKIDLSHMAFGMLENHARGSIKVKITIHTEEIKDNQI